MQAQACGAHAKPGSAREVAARLVRIARSLTYFLIRFLADQVSG